MMFGNLNLSQIQARTGVDFPEALIEYMNPKNQTSAKGIQSGFWHCFDMPFTLVCGDMQTAQEIYKYLGPLSSKFKKRMDIAVEEKESGVDHG